MVRFSYEKYHRKGVLIHRLLAEIFIYNDDPKHKTEIHHIDKNKTNNKISNLKWVTPEQHREYHKDDENHPFSKGSKHPGSKLKETDVHEICLIIENNLMSQHQIALKYNVDDSIIHEIKLKNNWKHISKLYDFNKYTNYDWKQTSEDTVRSICKDIVSNKYKAKEIAKRNNVNVDVVQRIRKQKSFKSIVLEYDFSKNTTIKIRKKK